MEWACHEAQLLPDVHRQYKPSQTACQVRWRVRLFSVEPDGGMLHLDQVRVDALYMLHVSFSWSNSKTRHGHDSSGVDPAKGYGTLDCTNE